MLEMSQFAKLSRYTVMQNTNLSYCRYSRTLIIRMLCIFNFEIPKYNWVLRQSDKWNTCMILDLLGLLYHSKVDRKGILDDLILPAN